MEIVQTIAPLVQALRPCFTSPTFANFVFLLTAWLNCPQRPSITNLIRHHPGNLRGLVANCAHHKHFSAFYRFFTRARWDLDSLGKVLAHKVLAHLPARIILLVDDSLFRRSGPKIMGAGIFVDSLRSPKTSTSGKKAQKVFAFGLNFVVLALWIPLDWMHSGGIAVPILFRLYRSKKLCPPKKYKKRTELALEMILVVVSWWPQRVMLVVGDSEYAGRTVASGLPEHIELAGPLPKRADLRSLEVVYCGRGRRPIWGKKVATPDELANDESVPWQTVSVQIYGRDVELWVKTCQVRWKSTGAARDLTVVITRDPKGRLGDRAFFLTQAQASVQQVLEAIGWRWTIEVAFRDSKQSLGLEQVGNGWWRAKTRSDKKVAGPQPPPVEREPVGSSRTIPFGMLCYSFVVVWYIEHGQPARDVALARAMAPWYRHKRTVSFADMLAAMRRQIVLETISARPQTSAFAEILAQIEAELPPEPVEPFVKVA